MGVFLGGGVSKVSTVDLVDWTSPGLVTMARPFCCKLQHRQVQHRPGPSYLLDEK